MVVPFPVVFCTTITLGLDVIGIVVILVVVPTFCETRNNVQFIMCMFPATVEVGELYRNHCD